MPVSTPASAEMFNETYPIISVFRTDTELVPYFNPEDSGEMILPGEPFVRDWGASGSRVYLAQGRIKPGNIGHVRTKWTADFPCDLSADAVEGDPIYWDPSAADDDNPAGLAKLGGDVTNGFIIGYASFAEQAGVVPEVDEDGKVICGTSDSTTIRVVYDDVAGTVKGTVGALSEPQMSTTSTKKKEPVQSESKK